EDKELYLRYVQLGTFSPIFRVHVNQGKYYKREPWRWDVQTFEIIREYMQLRHKLIPYIYTEAYNYHNNGVPLIQPIYYSNPSLYDEPLFRSEYYFGSELLVSPLTNKKDVIMDRVIHKFYLPQGMWYDFKTGKRFPGNRSYVSFFKDQDFPVFAKAGSIIPLADEITNNANLPQNMEIHVFPGKTNSYRLYEDDGITNLYKKGFYLTTLIDYNYQANNYTVIIRSIAGKSGIVPPQRNYKIRFRNTRPTEEVVAYFNDSQIEINTFEEDNDFIVELKNISTVGQLSINCKGKAIEIDALRLINEEIDSIISDLAIETNLKEKIAEILFGELTIRKKRIEIRKLKNKGLEKNFVKMFIRLLEYIAQI
ncbi:MAG: TIM-barrel domain-containing protein, partial [Bacilli bacterium]